MARGGREFVPEFERMKNRVMVRMQMPPAEQEGEAGRAWMSERRAKMEGLGYRLLQRSAVALEVSGTVSRGTYHDYSNQAVTSRRPIVSQTRREMGKHVQTLPDRLQDEAPCRMG